MNVFWHPDAACRTADPDLFFPDVGEQAWEAKKICGRCPVWGDCLAYAIQHRVRHGIWGGTTPNEREAMTRSWRRSGKLGQMKAPPP